MSTPVSAGDFVAKQPNQQHTSQPAMLTTRTSNGKYNALTSNNNISLFVHCQNE